MGVPRLLTTLSPFGDEKPIDGARVIIDGPALAYHVANLCMANPLMAAQRNHPLDVPTYDQLATVAVAWLDALRAQNVEM